MGVLYPEPFGSDVCRFRCSADAGYTETMQTVDPLGLVSLDPWLAPFSDALRRRSAHYERLRALIDETGGVLGPISLVHEWFGFTRGEDKGLP